MPTRPNLFIIGAMKSGTTSLHNYLNTHPDIAMSEEKEPGYFVEELSLHKGEEWYLNLFDRDKNYRYIGESSTHYTKLPLYQGVPERLFEFNRDARLIYVMRNPFKRTVSHYWHAVRDIHHGGEPLPILEAIETRPEYLAFSNYAMQLEPYIELFGRDAIYTLTFESLVKNPNEETNKIFAWLGLERCNIEAEGTQAHNQKPEKMMGVAGGGLLNRIEYSATWAKISPLIPSGLKHLAKRLAYKPVDESTADADIAELRRKIGPIQRQQIEQLCRLLDRTFPEWET